MSHSVFLTDGSMDFSGGVDSNKVTTIASESNPNGLARNQLAWLINGAIRDGGVMQRTGWQPTGTAVASMGLFQGSFMYEPDSGYPYIIALVAGHVWRVDPDFATAPVDLSAISGEVHPATPSKAYFCQAENYLIIQAGDYGVVGAPAPDATGHLGTLPLIWDGTTLRRSVGITDLTATPATGTHVNEIPAATAMKYYMQRVWYAQARQVSAGDIAGGDAAYPVGNPDYNHFRDSVLCVQENPQCVGGDGFSVPTNAGNIRALDCSAELDAALGQGRLLIFTRRTVYQLLVPVTRTNWIAANADTMPQMTVAQLTNGATSDRSIVSLNGDLFFQSLEPAIRTHIMATRFYGQWANPPVSINENRIMAANDRSLMHMATGITHNNRMLQAALPVQAPQGVIHQVILPLDFEPVSTFKNLQSPAWEGHYEGLNILQLLTGDFGGRDRAFSMTLSASGNLDVWELTSDQRFENGDQRVTWQIEFPAFTFGRDFDQKELAGAELWIDKLFGEVLFQLDYRPDGDPCWYEWHKWKLCTARNCAEDAFSPICYPVQPYRENYRRPVSMPKPQPVCTQGNNRPSTIGYQFQPRLTIHGWCRIRGILLYATPRETQIYEAIPCA